MRHQQRIAAAVVATLLALLTLSACGDDEEDPPAMTSSNGHPPMERMVDDYTEMRTAMVDALDTELGRRGWDVTPNNPSMIRSKCRAEEDERGERVSLPSYGFTGTYDAGDWKRAVELVWKVGREHGFTHTGTIVDRPDDLEVYGEDDHGGRYIFGLAENTVLGITTGCHRWTSTPTAESPKTEIPDFDKN